MNNTTTFGYKGLVNVKLKIGNKFIDISGHNTGTEYFKKIFCKFITGYYEPVDLPRYLDLRRNDDPTLEEQDKIWLSYLTQQLPIETEYPTIDETVGNWVATFTAVINYSNLMDEIPESDQGEYRLYLYTGVADDGKPEHKYSQDIAYIPISIADLARITPGTQALIQWRMQLTDVID